MTSETEKHVQQYLRGVNYPASKDALVSAAKSNGAPQNVIERLVDLPIQEYPDPFRVREALDGLSWPPQVGGGVRPQHSESEVRPVQPESEERPAQSGGEVVSAEDLKERVLEAIRAEWDKTRPPGGVGKVNSKDVYERLVAEGVDVPRGVMKGILEQLLDEGQISGAPYHEPAGIPIHGAFSIIEPGWQRQ